MFDNLCRHHDGSFIYILNRLSAVGIEQNLVQNGRDYDILHESLGMKFKLNSNYDCKYCLWFLHHTCVLGFAETRFYLQSKSYVPDRMLRKIDETTSAMFENGLAKFYQSFIAFQRKFIERVYLTPEDDDDVEALKMEQMIRPMTVIFYLWGISVIIFIAENIIWRFWIQ